MRYLAIECPASRGTWSCHAVRDLTPNDVYAAALAAADYDTWEAYEVPGDHGNAGAASAAWAAVRMGGTDEDGAAPVSVGVVMLTEGGR